MQHRSNSLPVTPRYADPATRIGRVVGPFREFTHTEAAGGVLLFIAALAALLWANSPWRASYEDLWHATLAIEVGDYGLSMSLAHWINDGLMVLFFFVVGLEIKREILLGELATPRQAALPIAAAAGGALIPALIFLAFNAGGAGQDGWGIPMATDIAFALGVMALFGDRIPLGLRVFVTALAIVDDLIAVVVIALFYTASVNLGYLMVAAAVVVVLLAVNRLDVTRPVVYGSLGVVLWLLFVKSGVHATIAGVILALTIPARTLLNAPQFLHVADTALADFRRAGVPDRPVRSNHAQQSALLELETAADLVQSPMQRLEHMLHPWTSFVIVPLFALANAGVYLGGGVVDVLVGPVSLGVIVGLVLGKQLGITLVSWLMVRRGWAGLPEGVSLRHIHGASCLAGIGFTMSLFIGELAFTEDALREAAKVGTLAASIIAGLLGAIALTMIARQSANTGNEETQPATP